jgi:hypothetical protein
MKAWVKIIVLFFILLCPLLFFTVKGQNYTIKQQRYSKDTTCFKNTLVFSSEKQKLINKILPDVEFYYYEHKSNNGKQLSMLWAGYKNKEYHLREQFNELLTDIDIDKKGKHLKKISEEEIVKVFLWTAMSYSNKELLSIDTFQYLGDYIFHFPNFPDRKAKVNYKISAKIRTYLPDAEDYSEHTVTLYVTINDKQIGYVIADFGDGNAFPFIYAYPVNRSFMLENSKNTK